MRKQRTERADQYRSRAFRDLTKSLAANIRRVRTVRGWSQEEAAHRCGLAPQLFQRIERAATNLTFTTLARLVEGFQIDVRKLFGQVTKFSKQRPGRPRQSVRLNLPK